MLKCYKYSCLFFIVSVLLFLPTIIHAQYFIHSEAPVNIDAVFTRKSIDARANKTFFNVLSVKNNSNRTESLSLTITVPEGWKLIGDERIELTLNPFDSTKIPIRVAVGSNVRGDIGYSVIASFADSRGNTLKNEYCFVKIPRDIDLTTRFLDRILYLDPTSETSSFSILIRNNGNRDEPINFQLDGGNLLGIGVHSNYRYSSDVVVPPYTDTIYTFNVSLRTQDLYGRINYGLNATVSSIDTTISTTIWFRLIESKLDNAVPSKEKVLVAEVVAKGLLDAQRKPIISNTLEGKVLFEGDRDIYYYYKNFSSRTNEDFYLNNRMHIGGHIGGWQFEAGDNLRSYGNNLFGRGGYLSYKNNKIKFEGLANKDNRIETSNIGAFGNYYFNRSSHLKLGGAYSVRESDDFQSLTGILGGGVKFLNNHYIAGYFALNNLQKHIDGKNEHLEFGGEFNYRSKFGGFTNAIKARFATPMFYGPQAGRTVVYANSRYSINPNHHTSIFITENRVTKPILQNNLIIRKTRNESREFKTEYLFQVTPSIQVYGGPSLENFRWEGLPGFLDDKFFNSLGYKMYLGARINDASGTFSISPKYEFARVNVLSDPFRESDIIASKEWMNYQYFSLSFRSRNINVLAFYTSGQKSAMDQINFLGYSRGNRRLQFMPSYDAYLYKNVIKGYLGLSYSNDIVSKSSYSNITGQLFWYLPNNWLAHSLAVYSLQSRTTPQEFVETYQNFYLEVGVKKEFNINQPRVRYHNVELVFFKDFNGNFIQEQNEPGIKNILVTISKEGSDVVGKIPGDLFSSELLSDNSGRVFITNIPEGRYKIVYNPIGSDAGTFSKAFGDIEVTVDRKGKYYFPFVEQNKVFGKIILNRSRLSGLGRVDVSNVRITATDSQGRSYSTLTDRNGEFVLFAPITDEYIVSINNIYYENFDLRQNSFLVQFNGYKQFEVNFVFDEKVRRINFAATDQDMQQGVQQVRRTTISGSVKDANTQQAIRAKVNLINTRTNAIVASVNSSATSGDYTLNFMASDDYLLEVLADDYWYFSENLVLQQVTTFMNINRNIQLKPISVGSSIELNIQFGANSDYLAPESVAELNRLLRQVRNNPTVRLEIQGHCDDLEAIQKPDIGRDRAGAVAKYLIENGFSNVEVKDMKNNVPLTSNDTEEGRARNRRIDVVVLRR